MSESQLIVAPHADDETLGCGGIIHKSNAQGWESHWLLITGMTSQHGYSDEQVRKRNSMVEAVALRLGFNTTTRLDLAPAELDLVPMQQLVASIGRAIRETRATRVFLPFPGDAHSDHRIVFEAGMACAKWFRYPDLRRVLAYETVSETGFGLDPGMPTFRPNWYENIEDHLEAKLDAFKLYASEAGDFPFPRSRETLEALARLRGSESGFAAAEAFMLLSSRHD